MQARDLAGGPWARVQTIHGFAADELSSTFQKSIRRGLVENAAIVAYELFASSSELEDLVWQRLETISVEDVGFGRPDAPLLIQALGQFRRHVPRDAPDRFLFMLHAVRLLALSPKDRTSDEMGTWVRRAVDGGEAKPDIFDDALDMHTRRGAELGRDFGHWFTHGARVENELPNRDLTYRQRVQAIVERETESP